MLPLPATVLMVRGQDDPKWNLGTLIAFRFVFTYLVLYNLPLPTRLPSVEDYLEGSFQNVWWKIVPWVASHILHLPRAITIFPGGSGDTTFNYVQVLCFLALAAASTILWSLLDRKRNNYERLYQWLRLSVRLVLGMWMLFYGALKVIPSQMPAPSLFALNDTYGESSPMGLLWTFMGASRGYEMFAGSAEMLGGLLLFVPGLATLGALVCIGVLTNVFMLNMCYDVPVKLFSFHLLLMAVFLVAPDLPGLSQLLVFRRKSHLKAISPLFQSKWLNRGLLVSQLVLGLFLATLSLCLSDQYSKQEAVKPPLYGAWLVEEYAIDGQSKPPLTTDSTRWRRMFVEFPGWVVIQSMTDELQGFGVKVDETTKSLAFSKRIDSNWKAELTYQNPQPDLLILEGQLGGHRLNAKLRRVDESKFLLTSRGFHWINEYPMVR